MSLPHVVRLHLLLHITRSSVRTQPFPLDYHQTLLSLLDVLSELYNKISKILGPSPFSSTHSMMGPLGLLSPHPGVSYLFSGAETGPANDSDSSLWGIAHAGTSSIYSGGPGSPPPSWTTTLGDTVRQIDSKLKVRVHPPISFSVRASYDPSVTICHDSTAEIDRHAVEGAGRLRARWDQGRVGITRSAPQTCLRRR